MIVECGSQLSILKGCSSFLVKKAPSSINSLKHHQVSTPKSTIKYQLLATYSVPLLIRLSDVHRKTGVELVSNGIVGRNLGTTTSQIRPHNTIVDKFGTSLSLNFGKANCGKKSDFFDSWVCHLEWKSLSCNFFTLLTILIHIPEELKSIMIWWHFTGC